MTTEQILDQELDNIEKMMASIRKMLEWPVPAHNLRDDHSPIDDANNESYQ